MDVLIVVPTLGERPELLEQCLASIALQSLRPRVTVVAGRRSDTVASLAARYGATVLEQTTTGLSQAINEGWEADEWRSDATGWLGDDDLLAPGAILATSRALRRKPHASMVHGRCLIIDDYGNRQAIIRNGWVAAVLAGWGVNLIAQPGSLFRTGLVRTVGGVDPCLRYAMDIDLYLKLRRLGTIASVPDVVASFRAHAGSLSTAGSAEAEQEARLVAQRHRSLPHTLAKPLDVLAVKACKAIFEVTKRLPA